MKNIKKILALGLSVVMVFGMTACSFSSNKALTMDVETGDKIKVECDTSDGLSMKWDKEDNIMTIKKGKDTVLELIFADEDHIEEYCEAANGEVDVKDTDEENGVVYTLFAAEDDDEEKFFIVGWIVGSDTGIIAEGTDSKKDTMNAFEALTFTVEDTDQDDDDFYVEDVEEIESKGDKDEDDKPSKPEETEPKDPENEPDETEPSEKPDETKPSEKPDETEPKDDDEEIVVKPSGELSTDWADFQIEINGKVLTLPCTYKELKEATGYSIKSAEEKSYLEPNYYTSCQLRDADGNSVCYIDILNNTDEDMAYVDGIVIEVSQDDWDVEDTGIKVNFAGFKVGDVTSKDELIAKFGQPVDVYEYRIDEDDDQEWKKYESDTYKWALDKDWTTMDFIEIEMNINTGIIQEIRIDHSGAIEN